MADKDADILATAKERFTYALDRESHNKSRQKEDIKFAAASPDDPWQWDPYDFKTRETQQRPALTINKMPLHIRQVTNDIRQNRPQVRFRPADDKADVEVANDLNGMVRHIEAHSQADMAYDCCVMGQVTHGEGYIRVLNDYISDDSFDQDIFIRRIDDPFRVHLDPDRLDPVGSDAKWGFIDDDMSDDEFKKQFPDAEPIDWTYASDQTWFTGDKRVRVVEYFEIEEKSKKLLLWANGATSFEGDPMPPGVYMGEVPIKERQSTQCKVIWRKLNGQQILDTKEFPSKYIPIVRAVGNEWKVEGKTYISGIVRNAKDSQRMYNVAQSAIVERVMLAPKAPFVAPFEAVKNHDTIWSTANTEPHAFLPYDHVDESGNPIPAPSRTEPATVETGLSQIAQGAAEDIKAETGQFDASLGQRSNETSGKAILARQREGDTATFHYVDNFAQTVRQLGVIILDMIPRVYDTKRVAKILGEDGEMTTATLDPSLPQAVQKVKQDDGSIARIFNPNVGFYDVYTTTGPSYTTRRVEAAEGMNMMIQANPELWRVIGDQFVKAQDWPGAEDMAERIKTVLLPEVQQSLNKDEAEAEIPPPVKAAMEQMNETVQKQQVQLQAAFKALQSADAQLEAAKADKENKEVENFIKAYDAKTKRLQVLGSAMQPEQVQALTMETVRAMLGQPEPIIDEMQESMQGMQEVPPDFPPIEEPPPEMVMQEQQPPSGGFSLSGQ